jgi:hypothetical protein
MERSRVFRYLITACFLILSLASSPLAQDDIILTLESGPSASDVTLQWTGGQSPWQVFRSVDPASVTAPGNSLGDTDLLMWVDSPPAVDLSFYQVSSCGRPASPAPRGCSTCDCCDPWGLSWEPVICARHYVVRWKCPLLNPEQVWNVGDVTSVNDVCVDIDMCNGMCSSGVDYIRVQACNPSGCSSSVNVPSSEIPRLCGGGCCCP